MGGKKRRWGFNFAYILLYEKFLLVLEGARLAVGLGLELICLMWLLQLQAAPFGKAAPRFSPVPSLPMKSLRSDTP